MGDLIVLAMSLRGLSLLIIRLNTDNIHNHLKKHLKTQRTTDVIYC